MHGLDEALLADLLARHAPDLAEAARPPIVAMAKGSLGRALELASGGEWLRHLPEGAEQRSPPSPRMPWRSTISLRRSPSGAPRTAFPVVIDLIQTVFGRIVACIHRSKRAAIVRRRRVEPVVGSTTRQGLDRWAGLWEKIGRLSAAVDGVNLDHAQALAQILSAMANPPEAEAALPFAGAASSLRDGLLA